MNLVKKIRRAGREKRPRGVADVRAGCCFHCVTAQLAVCNPVFP